MTVWRPAEMGWSVALLTVAITRVCIKPDISSVSRNKKYIFNFEQDLTRLPSKEHLRWWLTRELFAYRESTHNIMSVPFPYYMCNPP